MVDKDRAGEEAFMPVYVVTHRETKEVVVLVEASSREVAESSVAEAASADFFDSNGVPWEYEDSTDADDAEDDEKPEFRVNANEELEHVPDEKPEEGVTG